jgi:hypothetical protein
MISAREWNKMRSWCIQHQNPLPGKTCRLTRTATGVFLQPDVGAFRWRHPWHVQPEWNAKKNYWQTTIRPGFVNGIDPTINGIPLASDPAPAIVLPVAELGKKPIPFFERLGVRDPWEGIRLGGDFGVQIIDESWKDAFRPPPRRLAQCDIVLSIARAGLDGAVTIQDAASTGQRIDYTPRLNTTLLDSQGARPIIRAIAEFKKPTIPTLLERLMGEITDPQEDAMLLATVFLLSPPNYEGPIDQAWTPYVRHACFWNLAYATRAAKIDDPKPITLFTGLVGGMFDGFFNQLLAPGNEAVDRIRGAINSISPEGKFWTI